MKIVCPIEHQRIVIALVLPTWHGAFELRSPARPAHFFKQDWQQGPEHLWGDTIKNVAHLRVRGYLGHTKKCFEVAAPPPLLHFPLKLQKAGVLKEHHGKTAQECVVQTIVHTIRTPGIGEAPRSSDSRAIIASKVKLVKGRIG